MSDFHPRSSVKRANWPTERRDGVSKNKGPPVLWQYLSFKRMMPNLCFHYVRIALPSAI